ncbi:MAG: dihydrodipicolinate synthase family protein [Paracoccaceae bacterium]
MHGVIAAVPTPLDAGGKFMSGLFLSHCQWALDNGCDGLNILGSTGEANSFDSTTRISIMRAAAKNLDTSRLMVGTGTPSLAETVALTVAADDLLYPAALVLPPYYYKPLSGEGLFRWYEQLHAALGDRPIAVYFYNFPQMTGLEIPIPVIQRLHDRWPERFAGIKDSSGDLGYCRKLAAMMPKLKVFPSSEVSLAEAHKSGFAGCISATTNQTSVLSAKLWAARKLPDQSLAARISEIRDAIAGPALIPSVKYLVACRTNHSEWENLMPPFMSLSSEQKAILDPTIKLLSRG